MSKWAEFCLARIYMKWGVKTSPVRHGVIQKLIKCTFHSQEFIRRGKVKAGVSAWKFQKNIRLPQTRRTVASYSHRSKCLTLTPFPKLSFRVCPLYSFHGKNCSVRIQALWTCDASSVCMSRNPTLKLSPYVSGKGLVTQEPQWQLRLMPETFTSIFGSRVGSAITSFLHQKYEHPPPWNGKSHSPPCILQNQSNCSLELMLMHNLCTGFIRLFESFCDGDQQHR